MTHRPGNRSLVLRRVAAVVATAAVVWLGACSDEQDPGFDQQVDVDGGTRPQSETLEPCPDGGPDASTPAAGCLGPDGSVLRP